MIEYVIVSHGLASGDKDDSVGLYLESFDADAYQGRGYAAWTRDLNKAMKFAKPEDCHKIWRTISKTRRFRDDGKLNRPLTAYTIEIAACTRQEKTPS